MGKLKTTPVKEKTAGISPKPIEPDGTAKPQVPEEKRKKPAGVVWKTSYNGILKVPIWIKDVKGELVKKYVEFKNHTLIEFDPVKNAQLEKRHEEQLDLPMKDRDVLTEDEFYSITSPERLYIDYKGVKVHITDIRKALQLAEDNGWVPEYREVQITGHSRSTVHKGDMGAGSVKNL